MTTPKSVLGVSGMCRVDFGYPTQLQALIYLWERACVLGVLGLASRARMRDVFCIENEWRNFFLCEDGIPNKPNTLNTDRFNVLILKGFICVGFVLGSGFLCWVRFFGGTGDDR